LAAYNVVGKEYHRLDAATRDQVVAQYPRLNMKQHLCATFASTIAKCPSTRLGVLDKIGFLDMIQASPFVEE
jgi:hypothetical protein